MIIAKKFIKKIAERKGKKIGDPSITKIEKIIEESLTKIISKASKQADFFGRSVIKPEDIIAD